VSVTEAAAGVMSAHLGAEIALEQVGPPRRSAGRQTVIRHRVTAGPSGAPATVMVKTAGPAGVTLGFFNEWAALAFLGELRLDPPVSPEFFGGDAEAGILVSEDLGEGDGLADVLLGSHAAEAERALVALARTLGRMQTAAGSRIDEYRRCRAALGPPGGAAVIPPDELAPRFFDAVRSYDIPLAGAEQDLADVIAGIVAPGPLLGFVHGDAGPGNEQIVNGRSVLVDFATAGVRHVLLDGVCGRLSFPSNWCARRLPGGVAATMEGAYRAELAAGYPEAADDTAFAAGALTACAYWLVETAAVALSAQPFHDRTWGISTVGQRLAYRTTVFTAMAETADHYRPLARALSRLVAALGLDTEEMPTYPAFGGPALAGG
jgi:hypothetical protein